MDLPSWGGPSTLNLFQMRIICKCKYGAEERVLEGVPELLKPPRIANGADRAYL